jgi:hypothetical protein
VWEPADVVSTVMTVCVITSFWPFARVTVLVLLAMPMIPSSESELVLLLFEQLLQGGLNSNAGFEVLVIVVVLLVGVSMKPVAALSPNRCPNSCKGPEKRVIIARIPEKVVER